jgi:hypothetical protein
MLLFQLVRTESSASFYFILFYFIRVRKKAEHTRRSSIFEIGLAASILGKHHGILCLAQIRKIHASS